MAIELDTASYTLAPSRKELFFEKTITRLAEYTREHFATEEMLMKEFSYPDIEMHRQEHTKLIDLVNRRSLQQRAGDVTAASNLARDLKEWIFSHIALEDRRLGTFLSTRQRQVTDFVKSRIQENRLILRKGQVRLYQQVHSIIASRRSGKGEDRTTR
jgi:hemerythrin-like metal-binding protein